MKTKIPKRHNPNDNTTFKINRHKTPEELEKKMKQIQEMTATPEEKNNWKKILEMEKSPDSLLKTVNHTL